MEETSTHILCECEALASLRHAHLGYFFLEPKDIQSISLGARCIGAARSRTLDILKVIWLKAEVIGVL
jgi:hypothetical protein